jgi:hypothetical protein
VIHHAEQPFERSFLQRKGSRETRNHRSDYDDRFHGPYLSTLNIAIDLPTENFRIPEEVCAYSVPVWRFQESRIWKVRSSEREGGEAGTKERNLVGENYAGLSCNFTLPAAFRADGCNFRQAIENKRSIFLKNL